MAGQRDENPQGFFGVATLIMSDPRTDPQRTDLRSVGEINMFVKSCMTLFAFYPIDPTSIYDVGLYLSSWVKHTVLEKLHSSRLGTIKER